MEEAFASPRPNDSASYIDLFPIPVAVVRRTAAGIEIDVVNQAFRRAGLGSATDSSPVVRLLGERIAQHCDSGALREEFVWQFGETIDARYFRVVIARRKNAPPDRHIVSLIDETGAQRTETSLRREMLTDSLTGLPNRGGFGDQIDGTITRDNAGAHAVMIVNMDRFSRVNACMGSLAGDELLISVARRIKGALRGRDTLARIGGDEFGVLLATDEGAADALHVAKRIQAALATPFRLSDFEIRVDCSIGIALGDEEIVEPEDLIRHAQFAVKRAKKTGKAEVYNQSTFDIVRTQFGIETRLRRAIDNGEMRLTFQPICDLASGRIVSFESLARWSHEGREISPTDFIPVAEECGLIVPLGRWAMDAAARTIANWDVRAGGYCGANLAVNLSAIQFQRDQIAPMVRHAIEAHGVAGQRLTLELTESAIVTDPDRIAATLHALKSLGTTIAMDDFGTGYSNLAYLQKLPIDVLKIDRSFVSGMLADRDKVAIVRAVLSLAQALGMRTTAEGIETNELAQTLAALGCTYGQGYLYARPLECDDAYAFLTAHSA
ncbi:bifunctional diguanylate cyclase/phosphodiesterase [Sphingomonas donggukensis]|uniref:Bifunctional diguanylate cyclase/phosphodiesterase n=1 Tax=Sphingomonas donggukensis TaxID=2949093 RepID=A0ABY4U245_9SPHN|nr:bifunctional diguanylate cyclase/phosphodiesterase [Sphingomonas donggukensis]URW76866.1 bifunctional diguanylate cyclase/phosphodiesterase [Sphingomonas donggukensis]